MSIVTRARTEPHIWAWIFAIPVGIVIGLLFLMFGANGFWACLFALVAFALFGLFLERYLPGMNPDKPMENVGAAAAELRDDAAETADVAKAKAAELTAEAREEISEEIDEMRGRDDDDDDDDDDKDHDREAEARAEVKDEATVTEENTSGAGSDDQAGANDDDAADHSAAKHGDDRARSKPETLESARDGNADDLKKINGVGPKLEETLNSLGFYHFDQIANWSEDEVAWVDDNLEGFHGRIERDDWIAQARELAKG
ncbi:hypothetical protein ACMA5I_11435 [Paracoccaceae bacterium GXU_MW_L88]